MKHTKLSNLIGSVALELGQIIKDLEDAKIDYGQFFIAMKGGEAHGEWMLQLRVSNHLSAIEELLVSLHKYQKLVSTLFSKYNRVTLIERFSFEKHNPEPSDFQTLAGLLERTSMKFEPEYEDIVRFVTSIYDVDKEFGQTILFLLQRALKKIRHSLDGIVLIRGLLLQAELIAGDQSQGLPEQNWQFIKQNELRTILSRDYVELNALLGIKAFKSILVLSGSILEAVLVDVLKEQASSAILAYQELYAKKTGNCPPVEEWKLFQLIGVAERLGKLDEDSRRQADILRDYRNLIHPVLEIRRATVLDEELILAEVSLFKRIMRLLSNSAGQV